MNTLTNFQNLCVYFGLQYFTEAQTPDEFFMKSALLYTLFFIVSIVYFQFRDVFNFRFETADKPESSKEV